MADETTSTRVSWPMWLAALLWGLQFSFLVPSLGLVLVALYGASASQVGVVLAVYNIAGLVFSLVIPAWADRRRDYLVPMIGCGVLTVLLAAALWAATSLHLALVALVVLGGPAAVGNALYFAHLRHAGIGARQVMDLRALISFAWVVGMPTSTLLAGAFGTRSILVAIGATGLANLAVSLRLRRDDRAQREEGAAPRADDDTPVSWPVVAVMTVLYVLLQATNMSAVTVTSLLVTERLGLAVLWAGIALGIAAGLEVPALMLIGRLEKRVSSVVLLTTGIASGVLYYAGMTFATRPWQLLALQVPNAWFYGVVTGVGLTWFQATIPRPGLATGIFTNTNRVGAILGGPMIALGAATSLGYAGVFALGAVICAACLLVPALVGVRNRRRT